MNHQSLSIQFQIGSNIYETNKVCQISFKLASLQEWRRHKSYGHENSAVLQGIWTRMQLNTSRTSETPEHADKNNPGGEHFFFSPSKAGRWKEENVCPPGLGVPPPPRIDMEQGSGKSEQAKTFATPCPPPFFSASKQNPSCTPYPKGPSGHPDL